MTALPFTLTVSLCLVFTFVIFFLRERSQGGTSNADRDSLLPLAEETARPVGRAHDTCGCRTHRHPPCVGCLKRQKIS